VVIAALYSFGFLSSVSVSSFVHRRCVRVVLCSSSDGLVWFVFVLLCFCFVLLVFVDVSGSEIGWYCGFLTRKGLVLLTRKGRSNVLDSSHDLGSSASFL
jgi:hypothetical protein